MRDVADFQALVLRRLGEQGSNPNSAALGAGLKRDAIRSLLAGHSPGLDRVVEICAALGLELRIGPPGAVPEAITAALSLPADATVEDVLTAIADRPAALAAPPAPPPAAPDPATGLAPVTDRDLAEVLASFADAWEGADADGREDLRLRWQTSFPDLARRVLSLSGPRLSRLARGGGRTRQRG